MIVISVANQKGGVAKTTTVCNIAGIFAEQGYKTLITDADPQCSSTSYFFDDLLPQEETLAAIYQGDITEDTIRRVIRPTRINKLDIVPGGFSLSAQIWEIMQDRSSGLRLREFINLVGKIRDYDLVFIDCPPDIGLFTLGAFFASQYALIPIQPERLSVEGVKQLMAKITEFWNMRGEQKPQILGMFVSLFQGSIKSHKEWLPIIEQICGDYYLGVIHNASAIKQAADARSLLLEDRRSRKARPFQEHLKLAKQIKAKLKDYGEDIKPRKVL